MQRSQIIQEEVWKSRQVCGAEIFSCSANHLTTLQISPATHWGSWRPGWEPLENNISATFICSCSHFRLQDLQKHILFKLRPRVNLFHFIICDGLKEIDSNRQNQKGLSSLIHLPILFFISFCSIKHLDIATHARHSLLRPEMMSFKV